MYGYGNSMFLATHGILARSASGGGFDPDAQAFITAAAITNPTQQSAINTLVVDLKGYNIWTKMKAIYPIVGGSASSHAVNLKTPGTFNLSFTNAWTHNSTGMTPNGTSAYADTSLVPSTSLALDSLHLSYYSRTNITALQVDMGSSNNSNGQIFVNFNYGTQRYIAINRTGQLDNLLPNTTSLLIENRRSANFHQSYKSGSIFSNVGWASQFLNSYSIYIGAINTLNNAQQFSSKECAFASIGDGLTDTEAANFYTAVQAYQTTLGRQV